MANKGQRMVFEDEYKYLQDLKENHPDPSAEWSGSGSEYTAGTGIDITEDVISADITGGYGILVGTDLMTGSMSISPNPEVMAYKSELFSGSYNDLTDKPTIPTVPTNVSAFNNDAGYITANDIPSIPTTATSTSTSTVTPSTIQLTFTYTDDTTETVTLMTGATVSTTTNTTLS